MTGIKFEKRGGKLSMANGNESPQRSLIPGRPREAAAEDTVEGGVQGLSRRARGMRRKIATGALIALSVSLCLYAVFGHDGLVAYQQKRRQSTQLQRQILNAQKENERLAAQNRRLRSDPDTIEYEARQQMHYTRPGEVIYTLPEAPGSTPANHK